MIKIESSVGAIVHEPGSFEGRGIVRLGMFSEIDWRCHVALGHSGNGLFTLGSRSKLKRGCLVRCYDSSCQVGDRVSIGEYGVLSSHGGIAIDDEVIIGPHCVIHAAEHIFLSGTPIRFQGETARGVRIGRNVWIGANVTILDGVSIGSDAIIGAGAVVTKNIRAGAIAYGNPCRERRERGQL